MYKVRTEDPAGFQVVQEGVSALVLRTVLIPGKFLWI
jgi:hypothetical protein